MKARTLTVWMTGLLLSASFTSNAQNVPVATGRYTPDWDNLAQWECPEWFQNVKFGAGVKVTKKRAQNEKFYSIFFKKSREWKGQSPFPGAQFPYFRS